MAFSLARGHSLSPMRVREHRDRGEIKIEKNDATGRAKRRRKKKKEKRKIRTDKTFFSGVFLSNIHEVETTVCVRGNASVTKSVVHTWLPRIYAIQRSISRFQVTLKMCTMKFLIST